MSFRCMKKMVYLNYNYYENRNVLYHNLNVQILFQP